MARSKHGLEEEFESLLKTPGAARLLSGAAFDGLWMWDLENPNREWVSSGFWQIIGWDAEAARAQGERWQGQVLHTDRDRLTDGIEAHLKDESVPFDEVVRLKAVDGSVVEVRCRGAAIREEGQPVRMLGVWAALPDIESRMLDRQLAELLQLSGDAVLAWSRRYGVLRWNKGAEALFGISASQALGQDPNLLTRATYPEGFEDVLSRLDDGEQWSGEVERQHNDGSLIYTSSRFARIDTGVDDVLILEINRDVTDEHEARERMRLLNRELNHRVKNLFAVVQGLVAMTGRGEDDPSGLIDKIQDRVAALAAAHMISIDDEEVRVVSFKQVLEAVLAPYDQCDDQLTVSGIEAMLPRRAVTPIGMIFHELATNAVKYGAWSRDGGHLTVSWEVKSHSSGDNILIVSWLERFPRAGDTPPRSANGLGLPLIQQSARQLNGDLTRTWSQDGMEMMLSFSLGETVGGSRRRGGVSDATKRRASQ